MGIDPSAPDARGKKTAELAGEAKTSLSVFFCVPKAINPSSGSSNFPI
jgi:hypothetical protein